MRLTKFSSKVCYRIIILLGFLFSGNNILVSQTYKFKVFGPEDGLSDNFIYTLKQDKNGYLWLGTGEGVIRFDGFNFVSQFPGDTLAKSPARKSFIDSRDNVWFGFDNGQIAVLKDLKFKVFHGNESSITGFAEDKSGNILVATQSKGIIRISADDSLSSIFPGIENQFITAMSISNEGNLLLGTFEDLYLCTYLPETDIISECTEIEGFSYTNIRVIYSKPESPYIWIGTADRGLLKLMADGKGGYAATDFELEAQLSDYYIQDLMEDRNRNLWLATEGQGVLMLQAAEGDKFSEILMFDKDHGLSAQYIRSIYEDIEGNYWFASYGGGLLALRNQTFLFYTFDRETFHNDILSVYIDEDTYWLGGDKQIIKTSLKENTKYQVYDHSKGIPNDKITAILKDSEGAIWLGTSQSGLYRISEKGFKTERYFYSSNSLENIINSLALKNEMLYVATNGGLLIFDIHTGSIKKLTTEEGLPHNRIRHVFIDSKDRTWLATRSNGIYHVESKHELTIDVRTELEFVSIAEDQDGNLWAATSGDGVFMFNTDSLMHYSTNDGLKSNFCYSIAVDVNDMVWVGHRLGMSMINMKKDFIRTFSVEQGINSDCNTNAVAENKYGNLVFGTTQGLILYDQNREKDREQPPLLNITSLKISEKDYDFSKPINLPYNKYRLRIDFIGIYLSNPEKVSYQYKLDGYDDWSELSSVPYVNYSRLEDGNYTFLLRTFNDEGIYNDPPLSLKINIKIPVWKTWWFPVFIVLILFIVVYIIIKYRERQQKQIQEYLQKTLDERTKEVITQKEIIENKNRDITDSINYAQRIQASILPPVSRLLNYVSGGFVFYQPKDIVSGDFYWFDKVWGNKLIIVCADCTGHGVPGAFMSMIGTILIKDICSRKEIKSPSQVLETLDKEVKEALNQNGDSDRSNDGMDIIIAELDLGTNLLKLATAMRPVILYINGEQINVKGSRNAIGGRMEGEGEIKKFYDEEYQLSRGDIIYMFSDGYSDQFGGPLGKKFKMVRLKNLLKDINEKTMDEQYNYIKNNFMLWMDDLDQVDDVLFMGIRI